MIFITTPGLTTSFEQILRKNYTKLLELQALLPFFKRFAYYMNPSFWTNQIEQV